MSGKDKNGEDDGSRQLMTSSQEKGSSKKAAGHACAAPGCGKIGSFKLCVSCKTCRYCSPSCQRLHWQKGHKQQCSVWCAEREREAAYNAGMGAGAGPVMQLNEAGMDAANLECPICLETPTNPISPCQQLQHIFCRVCVNAMVVPLRMCVLCVVARFNQQRLCGLNAARMVDEQN